MENNEEYLLNKRNKEAEKYGDQAETIAGGKLRFNIKENVVTEGKESPTGKMQWQCEHFSWSVVHQKEEK